MAGRKRHYSNTSVFFTFLIAGGVLFLLPQDTTSKISLSFYDVFEPILRTDRNPQINTLNPQSENNETVSYSEYARLCKDYKNLYAQLMALHEKYERLAKVRSGLPHLSGGLKMAKVTTYVGNYNHEIIIDLGEDALIRPEQYVFSEQKNALIGVVSETTKTAAKVRLVTDAKQSLEVRIRRDGTDTDIPAMMIGNGTDVCKISMIEQRQDVREGDTVYAAAIPNKLDVPLIVGEVVAVKKDDLRPLLWDITVMPAEDLTRLSNVTVIIADETLLKWIEE